MTRDGQALPVGDRRQPSTPDGLAIAYPDQGYGSKALAALEANRRPIEEPDSSLASRIDSPTHPDHTLLGTAGALVTPIGLAHTSEYLSEHAILR